MLTCNMKFCISLLLSACLLMEVSSRITKRPKERCYPHRGFMLDSARKFFPVDAVKRILGFMHEAKMNVFHWHLTDNEGFNVQWDFDSMALTLASSNGGYYTHADLIDVVANATSLGIKVIPEIGTPSHCEAWHAVYPDLMADTNPDPSIEKYDEFDVKYKYGQIKPYLTNLFNEVYPKFSSDFVHFGHDEAFHNRLPEIETSLEFVDGIAKSLNKKSIIWDDPISFHSANVNKNDFTVQVWHDDALQSILSAGYDTIISTSQHWYVGNGGPANYQFPDSDFVQGAELVWWTSPNDDPYNDWIEWHIKTAGDVMWSDRCNYGPFGGGGW